MTNWPNEARRLFKAIADGLTPDERVYDAAMRPAEAFWSAFPDRFSAYRRFASAPPLIGPARTEKQEDLWTLYALSRVYEQLIFHRFPIRDARGEPRRPDAPWGEFLHFFSVMGMEPIAPRLDHHPFFHEIVEARLDPALDDAVLIEREIWPGLWFGDLVFARTGVSVRCGPRASIDPAIATRSTLYFAWTRPHRPVSDLSHGWGSNSQWATRFRRDYIDGAQLRYNVDGPHALVPAAATEFSRDDAGSGDEQLTLDQRIELLTHRCFVRTTLDDADLWPFDDSHAEPAPAATG